MTNMATPEENPDPVVQFNVRIPKSMREAVDTRRDRLGLSRDEWSRRVIEWALKQSEPTPVSRERLTKHVRRRKTS